MKGLLHPWGGHPPLLSKFFLLSISAFCGGRARPKWDFLLKFEWPLNQGAFVELQKSAASETISAEIGWSSTNAPLLGSRPGRCTSTYEYSVPHGTISRSVGPLITLCGRLRLPPPASAAARAGQMVICSDHGQLFSRKMCGTT